MGLDMYLYVKEPGEERYLEQYWRKANAIHAYLVDKAQKGRDDCKLHPVRRRTLEILRDICKNIVDMAEKEGFVFETDGERRKEDIMHEHFHTMWEKNQDFKPSEDLKWYCGNVLPTRSGFFFGSLEYDVNYFVDIFSTMEAMDDALQLEHARFYYQSSW